MQKAGSCARGQERFRLHPGSAHWQTRTRANLLHVIARSEATWQSASPQKTVRRNRTWGEFAAGYGFAQSVAFRFVLPQRNGLPRRGAAAPLLAMTGKRL